MSQEKKINVSQEEKVNISNEQWKELVESIKDGLYDQFVDSRRGCR